MSFADVSTFSSFITHSCETDAPGLAMKFSFRISFCNLFCCDCFLLCLALAQDYLNLKARKNKKIILMIATQRPITKGTELFYADDGT